MALGPTLTTLGSHGLLEMNSGSASTERSRQAVRQPQPPLVSSRIRVEFTSGFGTGKRDGYGIDKMGSFGLWFGDATNSAGRPWWNGFSRLESRRGANAVVRESGRLPSIRAGFAGYS